MFPLNLASENKLLKVKMIKGTDLARRHLENIGFSLDSNVSVISNNDGDIIVTIKNVRVGINSKMAGRILVEEV